jgi:hypothetical protein
MTPPVLDSLRRSVLRIYAATDPTELYGTAFGIAEHWALTCAHVVNEQAANSLQLAGAQGELAVVEIVVHPDDQNCDLALLRTDRPLCDLLACAASPTTPDLLVSRGYLPEDTGWGGHELKFTSRGLTNIAYGQSDPFFIANAFDLAGDMAAPGISGSPLLVPQTSAVLGIVSAGNSRRGRSWAVPLSAGGPWLPLQKALEWNDRNLPRFGRLVNYPGAVEVCRTQCMDTINALRRSRKFVKAWDVTRTGMSDIIAEFRSAKEPAVAIVGNANVGKTWLLSHLTSEIGTEPALLLLAAALDRRRPPSLEEFVEESLAVAWRRAESDPSLTIPSFTALASACADAGRPLLILLDGLNEALVVPGFYRDWLPDAIGLCTEHRSKLVMTSRVEAWPTLARAIPEPRNSLFVTQFSTHTPEDSAKDIADEKRYIHLADFNMEEAAAARQSYGIVGQSDDVLGHHPLLFRVAHDLGIDTFAPTVGRYKLLQNFVERQLDEVVTRVPGASIRSLRAGLQRIASASAPGGGGLGWKDTASGIGGDAVLTATLDIGLLVALGDQVRFAYDQIADVLRPTNVDPAEVFRRLSAREKIETHELADACTAILRFEAEGNEKQFLSAFDGLVACLDELSGGSVPVEVRETTGGFLEAAAGVAQALPRARGVEIEQLFRSLLPFRAIPPEWPLLQFETLGRWLGAAPLPTTLRSSLVLEVAPWDRCWPYRTKDWIDPSNRAQAFELTIDAIDSGRAGAVLNRLLREDPAGVRPVLIAALANEKKIQFGYSDHDAGEATIADLCAGLLFHRRGDDPEALYDALLDVDEGRAVIHLWRELAQLDPLRFATKAISRLKEMRSLLAARIVLPIASAQLDPNSQASAIKALEQFLRTKKLSDINIAAGIILRLDKEHLPTWDWLWHHGDPSYVNSYLSPIPAGRLATLPELMHENPDLTIKLITEHDGPAAEQQYLAALVRELLVEADPYLVGRLAEKKLQGISKDDRYTPWSDFLMALAIKGHQRTRCCLIYSAFLWPYPPPSETISDRIRRTMVESKLSSSEAELIVEKFCRHYPPEWFDLWKTMRSNNVAYADWHIHSGLQFETRMSQHDKRAMALAVLEFWRGLADEKHTPISRAAVEAADRGIPLEKIFSTEYRLPFAAMLSRSC